MSETTRRSVLAGAAGVGAAAVLAACGGGSDDTASTGTGSNTTQGTDPTAGQPQGGHDALLGWMTEVVV